MLSRGTRVVVGRGVGDKFGVAVAVGIEVDVSRASGVGVKVGVPVAAAVRVAQGMGVGSVWAWAGAQAAIDNRNMEIVHNHFISRYFLVRVIPGIPCFTEFHYTEMHGKLKVLLDIKMGQIGTLTADGGSQSPLRCLLASFNLDLR